MLRLLASFLMIFNLVACADDSPIKPGQDAGYDFSDGWVDQEVVDYTIPDGYALGKEVVYAHTADKLFEVDPETLQVKEIGTFAEPNVVETPRITDIALSKSGRMIGVTQTTVYEINVKTAECTALSTGNFHFVGLSYVVVNDVTDRDEYLMGLDKDGTVYDINPETGDAKVVGHLGFDWSDPSYNYRAAGDVVSIKGLGTYVTIERSPEFSLDSDWLAKVDVSTGMVEQLIGRVGYQGVWGLGFWNHEHQNKLFGFTNTGEFILINIQTGQGTEVSTNSEIQWWGAGVTTEAPIIE